jgi:hypothetical protein
MKYAIYLPTFDPFGSAQIIAGLARDAELAGWDGVFLIGDMLRKYSIPRTAAARDRVDPGIIGGINIRHTRRRINDHSEIILNTRRDVGPVEGRQSISTASGCRNTCSSNGRRILSIIDGDTYTLGQPI